MFLSGCGKKIDYDLPSDPVAFNMSQFVNPADKEDTYLSIELNGRTYVPYGTVEKSINGEIPAMVAAPGTSCRQQILDGTGVHAVHPIEIMYKWLR